MRNLFLFFGASLITIFSASTLDAQKATRKWVPSPPNTLGTGYYVVDSYDAAGSPWRPVYKFNDTLYQYKTGLWHHIANGPRSFIMQQGQPQPVFWHSINGDSTDNTFAGPIPIGFAFNFYGNDYDSVYLSSNGYIGFGNYLRASGGDGPSYASNKVSSGFPSAQLPKNIAAFMMTDGFLVHGNSDSSIAYYKTCLTNDSLFISLYSYFLTNAGLRGYIDKIRMDVQIVLTKNDSSITFMYRKFYGIVNIGLLSYQVDNLFRLGCAGCGSSQWASMIGVQDSTQTQGTTYMANTAFTSPGPNADMADAMAVQFKQQNNTYQADSIIVPTRNYEMLLGDTIQPVAVFGNISPTTQSFYGELRIRNAVNDTIIYEQKIAVMNLPSMTTQRVTFPAYFSSQKSPSHIGPMYIEGIALPLSGTGSDGWPFDDTVRQKMFVLDQIQPFEDFENNFSDPLLMPGPIPDASLWININANVVDGDNFTFSAPPPRGLKGDPNGTQLNSPVILMDRRDANGYYYDPCSTDVGDTIISFPVDIHSLKSPLLGFSYERGGKLSYPRWYDLSSALGPERTVTQVGNPANVYRTGDSLEIEFADPSQVTNVSNWKEVWAQDGGKDLNFQRVYLPVGSAYKTSDFRFRVRLKAKNDFEPGNPTDDADAWYLDNFSVRDESQPELEASFIRFNSSWSYTSVPASQATYVPIEAEVANNGGRVAQSFGLNVLVYPNPIRVRYYDTVTHQSIPIPDYSNLITIPVLEAGQTLLVNSGRWNARQSGPGQFNLVARIQPKGYDAEPENDSTYTTINMTFGDSYTYDQGTNDIPGFFGVDGLGLNLPASTTDPTSDPGGTSGTLAVKFKVYNADTVFGVKIFFGSSDTNNDSIRVMLYNSNDSVPGKKLQNGCLPLYATRQTPWDDFSTYLFSCGPVFLQPGDYWIGVTQVSTAGYEIGGNASRSSMDWIGYDPSNQQNIFAMNDPEMAGLFAYENIAGSGVWHPFEYPVGSGVAAPAYGSPQSEMAYSIKSSNCNKTYNYFIGQGSWIPMIRPYFKARPFVWLPIDVTSFDGKYIPNYIALAWNTASEVNNIGYYVERRGVIDAAWSTLNASLIPGNGTTAQPHSYSYDDRNIAMGTTYQYRLRQVDNNGDVHYSNTVEITTPFADYDLAQNYPNPFKSSTQISYTLPSSGSVTLKVYDMLGREVRSLVDEYEQSREYSVMWDGNDNGGAEVPSGAYLYKMTVNGHTFSKTLSLVR